MQRKLMRLHNFCRQFALRISETCPHDPPQLFGVRAEYEEFPALARLASGLQTVLETENENVKTNSESLSGCGFEFMFLQR